MDLAYKIAEFSAFFLFVAVGIYACVQFFKKNDTVSAEINAEFINK